MGKEKRLRVRPTDKHLQNVDTVFLFGAGTSAHMKLSESTGVPSCPTDASFFNVVKDGEPEKWCKNAEVLDIAQKARKRVFGALEDAGIDKEQFFQPSNEYPQVRLEEVFCKLDMLRMLGYHIHESTQSEQLRELLSTIMMAINGPSVDELLSRVDVLPSYNEYVGTIPEHGQWTHPVEALRDLIAIVMASGRPPSYDHDVGYPGFAARILRKQETKNANTYAVLSLNYELGLEFACNDLYEQDKSVYIAVREFMKEQGLPEGGPKPVFYYALPNRPSSPTNEAIPILKLHGSCNWGFCPECQNVADIWLGFSRQQSKIETLVGSRSDRECCPFHSADRHLVPRYISHIVPPTWNKWMGDYTMRHIWRQAYSVLANCKKLFIVGTSLPETDTHLRRMIQMALSRNFIKPEVYVVNSTGENTATAYGKRKSKREYRNRVNTALGFEVPNGNYKWDPFEEKNTLDWIFRHVLARP